MLKSANPLLWHSSSSPGVLTSVMSERPPGIARDPPGSPTGNDSVRHGLQPSITTATTTATPCGSTAGEKYIKLGKIGEGTYGVVYKAVTAIKRDIVALKKVYDPKKSNVSQQEGIPAASLREIIALKMLRHPNIVGLLDIVTQERCIYVVLEYMSTDLAQELEKMKKQSLPGLPERDVMVYAYQILSALAYCHERRMMHRDLKPQNILVEPQTKSIKIADFGLARSFKNAIEVPVTCEVVTLWYRAPEILLGCKMYTIAIDIWSTGFIVAEMISGVPLAPGDSEINQLYKIFQIFGTPSSNTWPGIAYHPNFEMEWPAWRPKPLRELLPRAVAIQIDLIKYLCRYKPGERLTAKRALQLPMFDFMRSKNTTPARATGLLPSGAATAVSSRRRQTMTCTGGFTAADTASLPPTLPTPVAGTTLSNNKNNNVASAFADASVYYSTPEYSFTSDTTGISSSQRSSGGRSTDSRGNSATRPVCKSKLMSSSQRLGANDSGFGSAGSSSGGKLPINSKRRVCFSVGDSDTRVDGNDDERETSEADDSMLQQPFIGTDSSFYAGKRHCAKTSVEKTDAAHRYQHAFTATCSTSSSSNVLFERSFSSRPASRSSTDGSMTTKPEFAISNNNDARTRAPPSFCLNDNTVADDADVDEDYCQLDDGRLVSAADGDMSLDTSMGDEMLLQQQQHQKNYEMHNKHHQNSTFLGSEGARDAIRDRTHGLLQRSMSNAACWPKDMLSSSSRS